MTRTNLTLQIVALIPFVLCAGGLYLAPELTPRWELGLLTYAAVSLSCLAGLRIVQPTPRWRGLPLLVPLAAWLAQLVETQSGFIILAITAIAFGILPRRHNPARLFASGAALCLIAAGVKAQSYGF